MELSRGKFEEEKKRYSYPFDWIMAHEKAGRLKNLTRELGGIPRQVKLSIFTERYVKEGEVDQAFLAFMKKEEERLSRYTHYFIPTKKVFSCLS